MQQGCDMDQRFYIMPKQDLYIFRLCKLTQKQLQVLQSQEANIVNFNL